MRASLQDQRAIDMIRGYATSVQPRSRVSFTRHLMDRGATVDGRANKRGSEMSNRSIQGLAKEREGREAAKERTKGEVGCVIKHHTVLSGERVQTKHNRAPNRIPDRPRHVIAVLDHGLVSKIIRNRFSTRSLYRLHDFFRIYIYIYIF